MAKGFLLPIFIAAFLAAGPVQRTTIEIEGLVLDPAGEPVPAARVTATTTCDMLVLDEAETNETDYEGRFVLEVVPEHCARVKLQASRYDEFWLTTGEWEDDLDNAGTAPVVDLTQALPDEPIVIRLGSRGGELSVETVDAEGSFWPTVVYLNRCLPGGTASYSGWAQTTVEAPISAHLLPEGSYCVGIVSANGMSPLKPSCTRVQVVAGKRQQIKLTVDPLTLTTQFQPPERSCPAD